MPPPQRGARHVWRLGMLMCRFCVDIGFNVVDLPDSCVCPPHAPSQRDEQVTYVDRVRAVCAILKIGNAEAASARKPAAHLAAIAAIKNGTVFRGGPFADYMEAHPAAAATAGRSGGGGMQATAGTSAAAAAK
eukprot:359773-Chlamydomonas_euryale.AAC.2